MSFTLDKECTGSSLISRVRSTVSESERWYVSVVRKNGVSVRSVRRGTNERGRDLGTGRVTVVW